MKAILEFDMNLSNDKALHRLALGGSKSYAVIIELENSLLEFKDNDNITIDESNCYNRVLRRLRDLKEEVEL